MQVDAAVCASLSFLNDLTRRPITVWRTAERSPAVSRRVARSVVGRFRISGQVSGITGRASALNCGTAVRLFLIPIRIARLSSVDLSRII